MIRKRINTSYVSAADKFLHQIKRKYGKSISQQAENNKYKHIAELRDNPQEINPADDSLKIWKEF